MEKIEVGDLLICDNIQTTPNSNIANENYRYLKDQYAICIKGNLDYRGPGLQRMVQVYFPVFMEYIDLYAYRFKKV